MAIPDPFLIESLGEIFSAVQTGNIFPDSKYFVDCIPTKEPGFIASIYRDQKALPGFNLKTFIQQHFILPAEAHSEYRSGNKPIIDHLEELWNVLLIQPSATGGTILPLPHPYVVPGGRFREIYYWDSYFTMLGLQVSKRTDILQHVVNNFAFLIDSYGFIPNGNRSYYLGRSQPPFFTSMVELLAEEKGDTILLQYLPQIEKEYYFWMDGADRVSPNARTHRRVVLLENGSLLNRYWDDNDTPRPESFSEDIHIARQSEREPKLVYRHIRAAAESGWDFSSRWFKDPNKMETIQTTDLIPVDLNCLLLHTEEVLLKIYTIQKETAAIDRFQAIIEKRKKTIQHYCWNNDKGFYFDYNHVMQQPSAHLTIAAAFPLFFKLADSTQAIQVAKRIETHFLKVGGILTTPYITQQQWDAPNGWAPLQWITYKGLKNYQQHTLAASIKERWMATNEKVYAETGKMMEKYNVLDSNTKAGGGEYPNQDGFGWTNGIYLKFHSEL